MRDLKQYINEYAQKGAELRKNFFNENSQKIILSGMIAAIAIAKGHKLLICGNGGSAADAQHIAGEFVNRFLLDRPGLPAIALTTDSSVLTAIANDSAYEKIFSRQVEALGVEGDILFAISTSGKSPNILDAVQTAKEKGIFSIGLTGPCNPMNEVCDITLNVSASETPLIQEIHFACEHMFCSLTEQFLFVNFSDIKSYLNMEGYPNAYI